MRAARVKAAAERRAKQETHLALNGLAGQKFGKHVVREGEVDVQLGEELSESLRGLQVSMLFNIFHATSDVHGSSPKATCSGIDFSTCNSVR
jgi:hypothetical protein